MAARVVGEKQRANRSLAGLHITEVFGADETRQRLANRQEKRFRRTPPARDLKRWSSGLGAMLENNPAESLVALEQAV